MALRDASRDENRAASMRGSDRRSPKNDPRRPVGAARTGMQREPEGSLASMDDDASSLNRLQWGGARVV